MPISQKEKLTENVEIFAWLPLDMLGIDLSVMQHYLNISPQAQLVKQWLRKLAPDRHRTMDDEVEWLLVVSFIVEAKYLQ